MYPEHRFSERYSSLSSKPRYMLNNTISQLNAEQWSRTYTLWLPWHQLIHCYLDNCKFLYTYQLACTVATELCFLKNFIASWGRVRISCIIFLFVNKNQPKFRLWLCLYKKKINLMGNSNSWKFKGKFEI